MAYPVLSVVPVRQLRGYDIWFAQQGVAREGSTDHELSLFSNKLQSENKV